VSCSAISHELWLLQLVVLHSLLSFGKADGTSSKAACRRLDVAGCADCAGGSRTVAGVQVSKCAACSSRVAFGAVATHRARQAATIRE